MADVIPIKKLKEIREEDRERWREMNRQEKTVLLKSVVAELVSEDLSHLSRREQRKLMDTIKKHAWEKIQQEKPCVPVRTEESE